MRKSTSTRGVGGVTDSLKSTQSSLATCLKVPSGESVVVMELRQRAAVWGEANPSGSLCPGMRKGVKSLESYRIKNIYRRKQANRDEPATR